MTAWRFMFRSLWYYRRTHVGVVLGAAIGTAVLVGALLVGDSVRGTLHAAAMARIGQVRLIIASGDRFFRAALADDFTGIGDTPPAAAFLARGVAASADGTAAANDVQIIGVDDRFMAFAPVPAQLTAPTADHVLLNRRLAEQLNAKPGQRVILRLDKPSLLARDVPLASGEDAALVVPLTVAAIVDDDQFGRFSLKADHIRPYNAFVLRSALADRLGLGGRANLLLLGDVPFGAANSALRQHLSLADMQLELRDLPDGRVELRSERVFIDQEEQPGAGIIGVGASPVLGYVANELRKGERSTPYSIVAAVASPGAKGLKADEVLINAWLADDLGADVGDWIEMTYYTVAGGRRLVERSGRFQVRRVLPMDDPLMDRTLMPNYPGLADADHCRDWNTAMPVRFDRIRDKDEAYWREYRGTPKAIVSYSAGARMWGSRFGNITAIRYGPFPDVGRRVSSAILQLVDPAAVGLGFKDVYQPALAAGRGATDFGGLFIGMSFFLIVAAVVLTGLLFVFGAEQRRRQTGTLLALGLTAAHVKRLLLFEGAVLSVIGAAIGAGLGVLYTKLILHGLGTIWQGAVASTALQFHARGATLITGTVAGVLIALAAMWLTLRSQVRRPAVQLLAGDAPHPARRGRAGRWRLVTVILVTAAVLLLIVGRDEQGMQAAAVFFIVGTIVLAAAIALSGSLLASPGRRSGTGTMSISRLGVRQCARRPWRSMATGTLLACGTFLVVAVGANRQDPSRTAALRQSGTGGFALFGRCSLPLMHDLNTPRGRAATGIDDVQMRNVSVVPMRVRDGDDASCLNLSRAQAPTLLGVDPKALDVRSAFTFASAADGKQGGWSLLDAPRDADAIPAIGDEATVVWGLGKSVGDTIEYSDAAGGTFRVRIVATIGNSILQGALIIAERDFEQLFPSEAGHRAFLIDAPPDTSRRVASGLTRALGDMGLELTETPQRLAMFNEVQNTYLSMFQALGGLGLILGSVGLGMVVLRNVLERRNELALLLAVGFTRRRVRWLLLSEHGVLVVFGVAGGLLAAAVAVLPALHAAQAGVPYVATTVAVAAITVSALGWVYVAVVASLRGRLLASLRSE